MGVTSFFVHFTWMEHLKLHKPTHGTIEKKNVRQLKKILSCCLGGNCPG